MAAKLKLPSVIHPPQGDVDDKDLQLLEDERKGVKQARGKPLRRVNHPPFR